METGCAARGDRLLHGGRRMPARGEVLYRERLAEVEALVVEQNVVDWVLAGAQVSDTPVPFDELMAANG